MNDQGTLPSYTQHQVVYQNVMRTQSNGAAVTSLVLGIVAITLGIWIPIPILGLFMMFLASVPTVLAVVFGHVGLRAAYRTGGVGRAAAVAGMVMGYVTLGLSVITTFVWLAAAVASAGSSQ